MTKITKDYKETIGLDLDDTIINHDQNRRKISQKLGLPESDRQVKKTIYTEISLNCPAIKGSIETINEWLNNGYKVFIVSRRQEDGQDFGRQWLKKYLPRIKSGHIFFVNKDEDKSIICSENKMTVFIDDSLTVLEHISRQTTKILFDPKKKFMTKNYSPDIGRVNTWKQIEKIVAKLS